jgi:hypothetical protein
MTQQIPGVPEGWEAVSFDYVSDGEHWLDKDGDPMQHTSSVRTQCKRLIIRKIEKPATYRPFASAEEAHPFWDTPLRLAGVTGDAKDSRFRITSIGRDGITTNAEFYSYEAAFYKFYVDDDGTPFGVRIDE